MHIFIILNCTGHLIQIMCSFLTYVLSKLILHSHKGIKGCYSLRWDLHGWSTVSIPPSSSPSSSKSNRQSWISSLRGYVDLFSFFFNILGTLPAGIVKHMSLLVLLAQQWQQAVWLKWMVQLDELLEYIVTNIQTEDGRHLCFDAVLKKTLPICHIGVHGPYFMVCTPHSFSTCFLGSRSCLQAHTQGSH